MMQITNNTLDIEPTDTGEKALLRAILIDARDTILTRRPRGRTGRGRVHAEKITAACVTEDEAWFASEDRSAWSFLWICEHLGLSASAVRRTLKDERIAAERKNSRIHQPNRVRTISTSRPWAWESNPSPYSPLHAAAGRCEP